jgi:hypothetical protein
MRGCLLPLIAVTLTAAAVGCGRAPSESATTRRAVAEIDAKVRPYDARAATDPARRHYAVMFRITNGVLTPEGGPAQIRPGNAPYYPPLTGGLLVVYRDANGTELGRYAIEDPGTVRSCDQAGGRSGAVAPLASGRVALVLPALPTIAQVDLGPSPERLTRFDISTSIQRAVPAPVDPADPSERPPADRS